MSHDLVLGRSEYFQHAFDAIAIELEAPQDPLTDAWFDQPEEALAASDEDHVRVADRHLLRRLAAFLGLRS